MHILHTLNRNKFEEDQPILIFSAHPPDTHIHTHAYATSHMVSQLDKHPVWRPPSAIGETVTTEQTILRQSKRIGSPLANRQTGLSLEPVKARLQMAIIVFLMSLRCSNGVHPLMVGQSSILPRKLETCIHTESARMGQAPLHLLHSQETQSISNSINVLTHAETEECKTWLTSILPLCSTQVM